MDKRAAGQYLDQLFGKRTGYVAVAHKDPKTPDDWQERQFAWPADRAKLLGWAGVHADANVFVCPALRRDAHTRKKGDMQPTSWLWADVDMQNVPAEKRADVEARISSLGTLVVHSGSAGDSGALNRHVYVNLGTPVDHEDHIRLNTGLKDYLYADTKQADNSLLRLPGTTNWKTEAGSPVKLAGGHGKAISRAALMKNRVFRDVKVIDDWTASEWEFVEPEGLSSRVKRLVSMPVAEAEARYGSRYKAVWAITGDLHRRAYDPSVIHSLMHTFPAALSKAADENGYDVHRDVDKRLAYDRAKSNIAEDTELDEDAGDVFEEMTTEEVEASLIGEGVEKELLRRAIKRAADQAEAVRGHTEPPPDTSYSLDDALMNPPDPTQYLIDDMCSAQGMVVISGQYKAGKTQLLVCSLMTALADNEPFLGTYDVHVPEGGMVCGHWNLEMSPLDLVDKYMRPAQYKNPHNVHLANWQGYRLNILSEPGKKAAVEWLTTRKVKAWSIDSWSALCRMCGVNPNDGSEVTMLIGALLEIKVAAEVDAIFLLGHIARASKDDDKPGTRGASELDEGVDTRWMFTLDSSDVRWLRTEGRGTQMENAVSMVFDKETGRSTVGTVSKSAAASESGVQLVVEILSAMRGQGLNKATLSRRIKEAKPKTGTRSIAQFIEEAEAAGFIEIKQEPSASGRGRPQVMHYLAGMEAPEGDSRRRATPGVVNLSSVGVRRFKKRAD